MAFHLSLYGAGTVRLSIFWQSSRLIAFVTAASIPIFQKFSRFMDHWAIRIYVNLEHIRLLTLLLPDRNDRVWIYSLGRSTLTALLRALSTVQVTCFLAWAYWDLIINFGNKPALLLIPQCVFQLMFIISIHAQFVFTRRCSSTGIVSLIPHGPSSLFDKLSHL